MAPPGLTITKLGVQARAEDDRIRGCLCVKAVLTGGLGDGVAAQVELFPGGPPEYLSRATILSLPLRERTSPSTSRSARHAQIAARLLALPLQQDSSTRCPRSDVSLHVEQTEGSVFLMAVPTTPKSRPERREWAVIMDFEASIPTPKCLENVVHLCLSSSIPAPDGDIGLESHPTIRFLTRVPSSHLAISFGTSRDSSSDRISQDDWEDAESYSESEEEGWETDQTAKESIWWEGRFPSTEALSLKWEAPYSDIPRLAIERMSSTSAHSFDVSFEAPIPAQTRSLKVVSILDPHLAWADLSLDADTLVTWHCIDGPWGSDFAAENMDSSLVSLSDTEADDSFATVRARKPGKDRHILLNGVSHLPSIDLFKQTLPRGQDDISQDFSFEMNSLQDGRPVWNGHTPTTGTASFVPMRGSTFELAFQASTRPQTLYVHGVLMHISSAVPVPNIRLPVFLLDGRPAPQLFVDCPTAALLQPSKDDPGMAHYTSEGYGSLIVSSQTPLPPVDSVTVDLLAVPTTPPASARWPRFGLLSWSNLLHLFLAYLILSQAQRFQRLQSEVGLVREEMEAQRELRLLSERRLQQFSEEVALRHRQTREPYLLGSGEEEVGTHGGEQYVGLDGLALRGEDSLDLSGPRGVWNKLASHPSIRSIETGFGWVWKAFRWLLGPG